jgi:hypothetical protein
MPKYRVKAHYVLFREYVVEGADFKEARNRATGCFLKNGTGAIPREVNLLDGEEVVEASFTGYMPEFEEIEEDEDADAM